MDDYTGGRNKLFITPATQAWLSRVGAHQIGLRKFAIGEGGYKGYSARAWLNADGELGWDDDAIAPTEEEEKAIEGEVAAAIKEGRFPKSIPAAKAEAKHQADIITSESKHRCECILYFAPGGEEVVFLEERQYTDDGKRVLPWSYWNDGQWRCMEPDGPLPLFGLQSVKDRHRIIIHEGAKAARDTQAMVDRRDASHPWMEDLRGAAHIGWPGGTSRVGDVDWETVKKMIAGKRGIIVADNDQHGIDAVTAISEILQMPLEVILFDSRFGEGFDLADPWPKGEDFWKGEKYVGPTFHDCLFPATWATRIGKAEGKGRPPILLRKEFAKEWFWVTKPSVFAHKNHTDRMLNEKEFNRSVRPFSDSANTAGLLVNHLPSKCDAVTYDPSRKPGLINVGNQRLLNTFRPTDIEAADGDPGPWIEFMTKLVPDEDDREKLLRWCATLIARPDIRMSYGVLLVSKKQGVGKGTLGEKILAPLVGIWNVSAPDEQKITDSNFNGWIAHKRLAVVHEIYAGHNVKAYNRLKSTITDTLITINRKHIEEYELEIWIHVFACSNSLRALKLDDDDRRWLVPRVTEEIQPDAYWRGLIAWLWDQGGLGIIRRWADDWLKVKGNEPVLAGQHAPSTTRKVELITEGRTDSYKLALDLARSICEQDENAAKEAAGKSEKWEKKKVVIAIDDFRYWAAGTLGLNLHDYRVDKAAVLLDAMEEGGLLPAVGPDGKKRRFDITHDGRKIKSYVVANFEIGPEVKWEGIKNYYRPRELLGPF